MSEKDAEWRRQQEALQYQLSTAMMHTLEQKSIENMTRTQLEQVRKRQFLNDGYSLVDIGPPWCGRSLWMVFIRTRSGLKALNGGINKAEMIYTKPSVLFRWSSVLLPLATNNHWFSMPVGPF